jgi:glutathione S-transferase
MITLYGYGPAFGLPDSSPFVTKAEMLLKLAGLAYRKQKATPQRAPKGKLPYLEDDGKIVADSSFIRWHIEAKYGIDFDQSLTAQQRGVAWALEKLIEDKLYWAMVQWLWLDDRRFRRVADFYFGALPFPLRPLIEGLARSRVRKDLHAQGMGRYTPAERQRIVAKTLASVAAILGDQPFLMGTEPCGADAAVYPFLATLLCAEFADPAQAAIGQEHPNLLRYVRMMEARYFPPAGTSEGMPTVTAHRPVPG